MRELLLGVSNFHSAAQADQALQDRFRLLADGQSPDTLFITCADSRVVPHLLASSEPGQLFVHRNVGNLMPPATADGISAGDHSEAAVVEYAVQFLNVCHIVICGHSGCGAMRALVDGVDQQTMPNLDLWLNLGRPCLDGVGYAEQLGAGRTPVDRISQRNVLLQLAHLRTYPCVRAALADERLSLHGWWFDIGAPEVLTYQTEAQAFMPLARAAG